MKERNKSKGKLLRFLISMAMVGTLVSAFVLIGAENVYADDPNPVCKIGDTEYTSVADAITAAGTEKTTITLIDDIDTGISIPTGSDIVLDMNGKTLGIQDQGWVSIAITVDGKLEIKGNGTVESIGTGSVWPTAIRVNDGSLIIDNGTFSATSLDDHYMVNTVCIDYGKNGSIEIKDGEFSGGGLIVSIGGGNAVIEKGTFTAQNDNMVLENSGTTIVKNGKFAGKLYSASGLKISGGYYSQNQVQVGNDENYNPINEEMSTNNVIAEGYKLADNTAADTKAIYPYKVLTAQGTDENAIEEVINLIDEIGEVVASDDCKAKIDAARAAYDKLNDQEKANVTNYQKLVDAEKKYEGFSQTPEVKGEGAMNPTIDSKQYENIGLEDDSDDTIPKDVKEIVKKAQQDNKKIEVELEVKEQAPTRPETKDEFKKIIDKKAQQNGVAKVSRLTFIDVSMILKVEGKDDIKITKTKKEVEFTITVPENLRKAFTDFAVVRNHDGVIDEVSRNYNKETGKITVVTDKFSDYGIYGWSEGTKHRFDDVKYDSWMGKCIEYVDDNGIMSGIGGNKFGPKKTTTREMLVQIFYNAEGCPKVSGKTPFTDVPEGKWYSDAIKWAYDNNITAGRSADKFALGAKLTRAEAVCFFYNYAKFKGLDVSKSAEIKDFEDADEIANWAAAATKWAVAENIMAGKTKDGKKFLAPDETATRAEAAQLIMNYLEKVSK